MSLTNEKAAQNQKPRELKDFSDLELAAALQQVSAEFERAKLNFQAVNQEIDRRRNAQPKIEAPVKSLKKK